MTVTTGDVPVFAIQGKPAHGVMIEFYGSPRSGRMAPLTFCYITSAICKLAEVDILVAVMALW